MVDLGISCPRVQVASPAGIIGKQVERTVHPDFAKGTRHSLKARRSKTAVNGFEIDRLSRRRPNQHRIERVSIECVSEDHAFWKGVKKRRDFALHGIGTALVQL